MASRSSLTASSRSVFVASSLFISLNSNGNGVRAYTKISRNLTHSLSFIMHSNYGRSEFNSFKVHFYL
jgi:hypothetical protein